MNAPIFMAEEDTLRIDGFLYIPQLTLARAKESTRKLKMIMIPRS